MCALDDLDTLDIVYIEAGKVYIMVGPFSADTLSVYQKEDILAVHALISNFRQLAHRVISYLQARYPILQQGFYVLRVKCLDIFRRDDTRDNRRLLQAFLHKGACHSHFVQHIFGRAQLYLQFLRLLGGHDLKFLRLVADE